jgi:hypothetical protein
MQGIGAGLVSIPSLAAAFYACWLHFAQSGALAEGTSRPTFRKHALALSHEVHENSQKHFVNENLGPGRTPRRATRTWRSTTPPTVSVTWTLLK